MSDATPAKQRRSIVSLVPVALGFVPFAGLGVGLGAALGWGWGLAAASLAMWVDLLIPSGRKAGA